MKDTKMQEITKENLPPRGEPYGGWKNYEDCQPCMSVQCCRPDCGNCAQPRQFGQLWAIEELLTVVAFFEGISKQMFINKSYPGRIKGILAHFDPEYNAHASAYNWTRIKKEVKELVKKFFSIGEKY